MQTRPSHYNTRYKHDLTPQQERVLRRIAGGQTNAEIAESLGLSLDGVKWHVRELLAKLNVESREDAAAWWREYRRPSARASRVLHGAMNAGAWKLGILSTGAVALGGLGLFVTLAWVSAPAGDSRAAPACKASDLDWQAQTQDQNGTTTYSLSISLREEQWYDHVLGAVGLGHPVKDRCDLNNVVGLELLNVGEPAPGPDGKPGPATRAAVPGVAGNPANVPVSAQLRKGSAVPVLQARLSNWCAAPAKLLIEASLPTSSDDGGPKTFTSLGTDVSSLPACTDPDAPTVFAAGPP